MFALQHEPRFIVRILPPQSAGGGSPVAGQRAAVQLLAGIAAICDRAMQAIKADPALIVQLVDLAAKGVKTGFAVDAFTMIHGAFVNQTSTTSFVPPPRFREFSNFANRASAQLAATIKNPLPPQPPPQLEGDDLSDRVTSFEFEESEKKNDVLKLTLDNSDLVLFDSKICTKGTKLLVSWGYAGKMSPPREVVVFTTKGGRTLNVEAHGKGMLMNKKTRQRTFQGKTRAEVARQIAKENGFSAESQDIEDTPTRHGVITQPGQTDAQFLRTLAQREGYEFYVDFDGFHFHQRRLMQRPIILWQFYLPPAVGDIIDFSIDSDITAKPGSVAVKGRDPLEKKDFEAKAEGGTTPTTALATEMEVVDEVTGATAMKSIVASSATTSTTAATTADAKTEAKATFNNVQKSAVLLTLDVVGNPDIVAKTVVMIQGLGKRFSGRYYVFEISHKLDSSGYVMKVKCRSNGTGLPTGPKAESKADVNTKDPNGAAGSGALTEVETVDTVDGTTKVSWKDTRGRDAAEAGK